MRSASTVPVAITSAFVLTLLATPFAAAQNTNRAESWLPPYIMPVHARIEPQRSVLGGDEITLASEWQLDANCKSVDLPTIKVLKEPKGGTLSFREAKRTLLSSAMRATCRAREVSAVDIVYKARADFSGTDRLEIDIGYQKGITRKVAYTINVRKATIASANIEEAEFPLRRSVLAGSEISVGTIRDYGQNCEPFPAPAIRVLKDASGGTLSFRETKYTIRTRDGKGACEGKVVNGVEYAYKARTDFSGSDEPEIEIGFRSGTTRKIKLTVAVRGMKDGVQDAKIDTSIKENTSKRDVFSGNEIRVAAPNVVQTDCSTGQIPDVRVVVAPEHGDLRFDTIRMPVDRKSGNSRSHCNGKEIEARAYFYKSSDGFTGDDKFTVDVDYKTGKVERYTYNMRVR